MARSRRHERPIVLGLIVVVLGAILLAVALPFVAGWLVYLLPSARPGPSPTVCYENYCQTYITIFAPPNPYPLFIAYAVAVPNVLVVAWRMRRGLREPRRTGQKGPRVLRWGSLLLLVTMSSMAVFLVAATLASDPSSPVPVWLRGLFLGSLLVAPVLVLGVGSVYLWKVERGDLTAPAPLAPE